MPLTRTACCLEWSRGSVDTATAWDCRTSAARWCSTRRISATRLVNALCVGVVPHDRIQLSAASGVGNHIVLFGAKTGGDGIGGVSVLASETFDDGGPSKRPSVQVGDPFAEKVLIEACQELFAQGLVVGIQDLGGAGISCATSEMASNGEGGMHVWLDRVPLRDSTLAPEEILMSESQERMCAVVSPATSLDEFMAVCRKWDVEAVVIGVVTDSGRLTIDWHGDQIVDVPPKTVAHEGPVYVRPFSRPANRWMRCRPMTPTSQRLARPRTAEELRANLAAAWWRRRTWRRSRGSPTSTTVTSWVTPCWLSLRTRA